MPPCIYPPRSAVREPIQFVLHAGQRVARVHHIERELFEFNCRVRWPGVYGGGRFDAMPTDIFCYLYAAGHHRTALGETLLRGKAADVGRTQASRYNDLKSLKIGWFATENDLHLADLRNEVGLDAIGQDDWLTQCSGKGYEFTRKWGSYIRQAAPWVQGIVWSSRRDPNGLSYVFYEDRCPAKNFTIIEDDIPLSRDEQHLHEGRGLMLVYDCLEKLEGTTTGPSILGQSGT